ncbi:hypothetical protein ACTMU2_05470 [Cupriavidus basilensis]
MTPADLIRLLSLAAIWGPARLSVSELPALGPLPAAFVRVLIGAVTLAARSAGTRLAVGHARGKWPAVLMRWGR